MATEFRFDEGTHTYTLGGIVLPSVTQVLKFAGYYEGMQFIPADILRWKAKFGSSLHEITRKYDNGTLDWSRMNPAFRNRFEQYLQFCDDMGVEILDIEQPLYSERFMFAGKRDRTLLLHNSKRKGKTILDIKSGVDLSGAELQTAGYQILENERYPDDRVIHRACLQLMEDGYRLVYHRNPYDEYRFLNELAKYRANKQGGE